VTWIAFGYQSKPSLRHAIASNLPIKPSAERFTHAFVTYALIHGHLTKM
jgi:hypothetical protein